MWAMPGPDTPYVLHLESEQDTAACAERLARATGPGDTILLSGVVGAGKSSFIRSFIATRLADEEREEHIPSPSYTLVNIYETRTARIWHADLYRLAGGGEGEEIAELGLADAFGVDLVLVEWPDRLGTFLPPRYLLCHLEPSSEHGRALSITPMGGGWDAAIAVLEGADA